MSTKQGGVSRHLRRGISLLLAVCILGGLATEALAASVGSSSSAVVDSSTITFVKLSKAVNIFTTETTPTTGAIEVASGTVLMLASTDTYTDTATATEYGCIYYQSKRYNVLWSDVSASIMDSAAVLTYVTGTLWTASTYASLKKSLELKRDVQVYGLQLALKTLGYYSDVLDGSYGLVTEAAVAKFQRAYGLEADGYAGPITQKVLYPLAIVAYATGSTSTGDSTTGSLVTKVSINLRKSYSTKTARLAVVPKKTTLYYTKTHTTSGVTWYYVSYGTLSGWLMGTYVTVSGSSSSSSSTTAIGTVTITMANTRIRKTANGSKTGYVLSKGSTVDLLATPTTAGGYTWYYIQTSSGVKGYVRGDCATVSYDVSSGLTPSTTKTYVKLSADTTLTNSAGSVTVAAGTVLQMYSTDTFTESSVVYCTLYYKNTKYNCVYSTVSSSIMTATELSTYIIGTMWPAGYVTTVKQDLDLVGDINVHAVQYALTVLGYYTGALDGNFGAGTTSAVRNFQRAYDLTVDGSVGSETTPVLYTKAIAAVSGTSGSDVTDFGTITSIEKASWTFGDNGATLFPKGATATVMDVATQMVFKVYRWSGAYHADCVPLTAADTKTMCDIVGFTYNSSHPTSTQLAKIKADATNSNATYTWPDFKGTLTSASSIGSAWDRRPALLNYNGRVFCVSIYGWPHGFNGTDSFSTSKFADGTLFYSRNNYYGMMCVHFVGSYTHTAGTVDSNHQASINSAYAFAKTKWPSLVK